MSLRRRRSMMSRWMRKISRLRRSAGLSSGASGSALRSSDVGGLGLAVGTVCGSCTRASAPSVLAGRVSNASVAPSWGSAPPWGTTSSSMLARWKGSIPRWRSSRTAS